ncbi:hypothetical protein K0I73_15605 [Shewanella mesophila]|uniref:hypothetical protein n=1 Tax=Shewanella mesophila TaxID=2864208 RepID=UPI001C65DA78|nr:hypothetical protein [Shewanella mesophila]QYJ85598.1 hypothetical protein K0I73_15605 [Shewanella mesophila]
MKSINLSTLLQPYEEFSLSAFDNMKLIRALLNELGEGCDCLELPRIKEGGETRNGYYVNWQGNWFDCGWTNDYSASIEQVLPPSQQAIETARKVAVPTLTLQQVSFMCMEYSHFDHC